MNWDQLKTILWLRWRLTRNQMTRSKEIGAVVAVVIAIGTVLLGGASFAGGIVLGVFGLAKASVPLFWGIWFGLTAAFLFFWMLGLVVELQRSESIDLQKLMHLPVSLGQIFFINYVASHLTISTVLFVPGFVGLAIGLAISRGPVMLLLVPLALCMVYMVTAWTYCLRGWLSALMSNPRQRRTVVMVIMFTFILAGQAPNLYFNVFRRPYPPPTNGPSGQTRDQRGQPSVNVNTKFNDLHLVQKFVPPFWVPAGAEALAEGQTLPAVGGAFGCFVLGGLGLWRAYRGTVRFYRGESGKKIAARTEQPRKTASVAPPAQAGRGFMEMRPPFVPEQAAALGLATFRSLLRAPEVKVAWGTSMLVPLIAGGSFIFRSTAQMPEAAKPFAATGAIVFSVFMLVQFFSNQFGFDRDGFRALVLSPANRSLILLGKNLACLPVGAGFSLVLLSLMAVRLHFSIWIVAAAAFQMAAVLMLAGMVGNLLSVLVPFRIRAGSLKPTKMPAAATVVMIVCHLLFPVALAPIFLAPLAGWIWQNAGWPMAAGVNLALSAGLAGLTALAYWQAMGPLGRLLRSRETKILSIVSVEVE